MSNEKSIDKLNETYDASCTLLKESLIDIILGSTDNLFKIHSLAKLDLVDANEQTFEHRLDFLFNRLKHKYLSMNSKDLKEDDFDLSEINLEKEDANLNDHFYSLDVDLKKKQKSEDFDFDLAIKKNTFDDFEELKNDNLNQSNDEFDF